MNEEPLLFMKLVVGDVVFINLIEKENDHLDVQIRLVDFIEL